MINVHCSGGETLPGFTEYSPAKTILSVKTYLLPGGKGGLMDRPAESELRGHYQFGHP